MAGGYSCSSGAWQADDDILPADLPQPNSYRLFFMRVTVEFNNPGGRHTTRIVKDLSVQIDESMGLTREAWDLIRDVLNQMGSPVSAIGETIAQLTCCALQMVKDPANAGRLVLPMEALVTCVADESEEVVVAEAAECAVCLVEMTVGSVGSRLGCMHVFHESCIGEWFTYNRSCPVCRYS
ncbi:hypothetical protein L6452_07053 [Arctium lappa]|uniref:Uncharacterized protein n=1 Tax=Arctium lappa TaxID=4217 RepID=A0ACB9EKF5_ARCLA|nr:hypothetical protein L6452_07053 [Arctium lappa]